MPGDAIQEVVLLVGLNSYDITIMVMTVDLRKPWGTPG